MERRLKLAGLWIIAVKDFELYIWIVFPPLHLFYDISLHPTLWLHTLVTRIYWGSAAIEYLIVKNVWFTIDDISSYIQWSFNSFDTGKD